MSEENYNAVEGSSVSHNELAPRNFRKRTRCENIQGRER
jgi:hypothetical protein